jgi:hypothetical protein
MEDLEYKGYEDYLVERTENFKYDSIIYRFDFGFGYEVCVVINLNLMVSNLTISRLENGAYHIVYDIPPTSGIGCIVCFSSEEVLGYFDEIKDSIYEKHKGEIL